MPGTSNRAPRSTRSRPRSTCRNCFLLRVARQPLCHWLPVKREERSRPAEANSSLSFCANGSRFKRWRPRQRIRHSAHWTRMIFRCGTSADSQRMKPTNSPHETGGQESSVTLYISTGHSVSSDSSARVPVIPCADEATGREPTHCTILEGRCRPFGCRTRLIHSVQMSLAINAKQQSTRSSTNNTKVTRRTESGAVRETTHVCVTSYGGRVTKAANQPASRR